MGPLPKLISLPCVHDVVLTRVFVLSWMMAVHICIVIYWHSQQRMFECLVVRHFDLIDSWKFLALDILFLKSSGIRYSMATVIPCFVSILLERSLSH